MLWYSYSSLVGVDINFIDYFVHKTVKAQLSPIYLIKRFKGFWGGGGGGGGEGAGWGLGLYGGWRKDFIISVLRGKI